MSVLTDYPDLDALFVASITELMLTGRSSISLRVEDAEGTNLRFVFAHGTTEAYLPEGCLRSTWLSFMDRALQRAGSSSRLPSAPKSTY
jgi:hypothetical protein